MSDLRYLRLVGATGAVLRTASFEGRQHVVVPVVALVGNEVVFASNAPNPEFVPAEEIAKSVAEWCGRPIVGDHPQVNGRFVSANPPEIAERVCFGRIANPSFEDNKLKMEAWLDRARCAELGGEAADVLARAEASEPIEVSVGVRINVENVEGVAPNGKKYKGVWRDLGSDHLAMLPDGTIGACSIAMGCGVRAARHAVTSSGLELVPEEDGEVKKSLRDAIRSIFGGKESLDLLRFRGAVEQESKSDSEVRESLYQALFASEPAFLGVDAVFSSEKMVVYAVAPENKVAIYRRGFDFAENGSITLAEAKEQVEPVVTYQPVTAAQEGKEIAAAAQCSCVHKDSAADGAEVDNMSKQLAERVSALISNPKTPFNDTHKAMLESAGDDGLKALEAHYEEKPAVAPTPPTPPTPPAPQASPAKTEPDPAMASIPAAELAALRGMAAREQARQQLRAAELVTQIVGSKQDAYTEDELRSMGLDELERVAKLLKVANPVQPADHSQRLWPRAAGEQHQGPPPAPDMARVAREMRGLPNA